MVERFPQQSQLLTMCLLSISWKNTLPSSHLVQSSLVSRSGRRVSPWLRWSLMVHRSLADADWNLLTRTPAMQIMGYRSAFTVDGYFYPGANISTQYENGTIYAVPWLARYSSPGFTGPLETGGDFYNFVVLDLLPASYNESYNQWVNSSNNNDNQQSAQRTKRDTSAPANWNEVSSAYPTDTISAQDDLGLVSPGYVTGYFLEDISTAVVSIPSFDIYGDDDESFERAIVDFVNNATARNATKLVIDLQQNFGGYESLVFEAIRQLFPSISPPPTPSRVSSQLGEGISNVRDRVTDLVLAARCVHIPLATTLDRSRQHTSIRLTRTTKTTTTWWPTNGQSLIASASTPSKTSVLGKSFLVP